MRLGAIVVGLMVSLSGVANEIAPPWANPEALVAFAKSSDLATVDALLYQNKEGWSRVKAQVASGDPSWIDAAKVLRRTTDGGMSSELHDAMFEALRANPEEVLAQAEPEFKLSVLCGGRADPLPTFQAAESEQASTIAAVRAISSKSLESRKNSCLAHLEQGRANLKRFFKVGASGAF
jgi:hypothetical protein